MKSEKCIPSLLEKALPSACLGWSVRFIMLEEKAVRANNTAVNCFCILGISIIADKVLQGHFKFSWPPEKDKTALHTF